MRAKSFTQAIEVERMMPRGQVLLHANALRKDKRA